MKKRYLLILLLILLFSAFSCKSISRYSGNGSFSIINYSDKTIEFVWISKEGEFYPTSRDINVVYGGSYEMSGLEPGIYDIAIDFKGEFNSFNSKRDKSLCLEIEKGIKKVWIVDELYNIIRN